MRGALPAVTSVVTGKDKRWVIYNPAFPPRFLKTASGCRAEPEGPAGSAWAGLGGEAEVGLPVGRGGDRPTPCPRPPPPRDGL